MDTAPCVGDGHVEGDAGPSADRRARSGRTRARGDGLAGAEGGGDRLADDLGELVRGVVGDQVGREQHGAHGVGRGDLAHGQRAGRDDDGDQRRRRGGAGRRATRPRTAAPAAQGGQTASQDPPSPGPAPSRAVQPPPGAAAPPRGRPGSRPRQCAGPLRPAARTEGDPVERPPAGARRAVVGFRRRASRPEPTAAPT